MARQCSTPGCVLQQFHLGLCDTRGTRSLCKTSESAGKLEASRRDRFGVSGGIKKNRKGAGKMDPPKFDGGDRVEVYFNDHVWYPGTVVRWVRIPVQRTYKYEVRFDSGLQLPFERYPLERGVIAEGDDRPELPDPVVPPPKPKTARARPPPALPSGLAPTPFRRIRFGDRVCVAWTATAHYYGVVRDTATRLEGKKAQRGIHVSYEDGTKTWHWEKDNDGMEVALIPTGPQASNSAVVVYEPPGMNVADESDEGEAAAAPAPPPAKAKVDEAKADEAKLEAMKKQMQEMKRQMQVQQQELRDQVAMEAMKKQMQEMKRQLQVQQQELRDQVAMEAMKKEMEEMKRQMQVQQQELQDQAARLKAREEAASAQAAPPADEPSKTAIQTMDGGFMEAERLLDILHTMDGVPCLGGVLTNFNLERITKSEFIFQVRKAVGSERLCAALGQKQLLPAPAPAPTPPQQPSAAAPDEPTTVAHIVDVAGTACEN